MAASSSTTRIRIGARCTPSFCTGQAEGALKRVPVSLQVPFSRSAGRGGAIECARICRREEASLGKALFGHIGNPELSALREELLRLEARVRIIEESQQSVRPNTTYRVASVGERSAPERAEKSVRRGDAA